MNWFARFILDSLFFFPISRYLYGSGYFTLGCCKFMHLLIEMRILVMVEALSIRL